MYFLSLAPCVSHTDLQIQSIPSFPNVHTVLRRCLKFHYRTLEFCVGVQFTVQYSIILGPTDRWCPMSPHFLTRWVSKLMGLAQVSWATARVGVHRLFPFRLPHLGVFPFTLHMPLDFIHVSTLRPTYLQPFDRPFTC